jgi:hypothetical protein
MFRVLTILAAAVALAVSAAPASAAPASATTPLDNIAVGSVTDTASGTVSVGETVGGRRIQKFLRRGGLGR